MEWKVHKQKKFHRNYHFLLSEGAIKEWNFTEIIISCWLEHAEYNISILWKNLGGPFKRIREKLKKLKAKLKWWNKEVLFGVMDLNIEKIVKEVNFAIFFSGKKFYWIN